MKILYALNISDTIIYKIFKKDIKYKNKFLIKKINNIIIIFNNINKIDLIEKLKLLTNFEFSLKIQCKIKYLKKYLILIVNKN